MTAQPPDRPNILLITTDQQHYSTLGTINDRIHTPNLDRLCAAGTRFDRAYCPNPVCTPSRASIITGMMPSHHGAWTIGVRLDPETPTVGGLLSQAGYATSLIGKAHFEPLGGPVSLEKQPELRDIAFWRGFTGPYYGFDHVELVRCHTDESHVGQHYAAWLEDQGLSDWRDYFQPLPNHVSSKAPRLSDAGPGFTRADRAWALPEDLHYTRWITDRSLAAIDRAGAEGKPFFLWTSFPDPHPPCTVPEPWASMYDPADMQPGTLAPGEHDLNPPHFGMTQTENPDFGDWHVPHTAHGCQSHLYPEEELRKDMAVYYGMISFMDQQIGRLLDHLDAQGLTENTLIVFTTDHGHFLGQHGLIAKGPFHYEDMLRVPFIASWPGRIPRGAQSGAIQSLVDLTPSFLHATGAGPHDIYQGVSQLETWCGGDPARDFAICENRHNPQMPHAVTYVEQDAKITIYRTADYGELFDLTSDPSEIRNLWSDPTAADLKGRLLHGMAQGFLRQEPTRHQRVAGA